MTRSEAGGRDLRPEINPAIDRFESMWSTLSELLEGRLSLLVGIVASRFVCMLKSFLSLLICNDTFQSLEE